MDHEAYMRRALELAAQAAEQGDVPVGCVIVRDGEIVGEGRNRREENGDATAHAEMLAIRQACQTLGNWRLTGCTLLVTLEPCPMCTGAILQSRLSQVVFGAFDPRAGCCGSLLALTEEEFECHPALYGGVKEQECLALLQSFFARRRKTTER